MVQYLYYRLEYTYLISFAWIQWSAWCMEIQVLLFGTLWDFFPQNIFNLRLVDYMDAKPRDTEVQLYMQSI